MSDHLGGHLNKTHVDLGTLTYIKEKYNIKSLIDVGCGPGGVVKEAQSLGISSVGIDGDTSLRGVWNKENISAIEHDFTFEPPNIGKYDLCWSVEFLEHVEEHYMYNYFCIFKNCHYVVCTAAPPGTPGHHHVNCREKEYWIERFEERGFKYMLEESENIKKVSTMKKPFMQKHGMFYRNNSWG
jgi:SAM-dependent methyltransferase